MGEKKSERPKRINWRWAEHIIRMKDVRFHKRAETMKPGGCRTRGSNFGPKKVPPFICRLSYLL